MAFQNPDLGEEYDNLTSDLMLEIYKLIDGGALGASSHGSDGVIQLSDGSGNLISDLNFIFDRVNKRLGIGTATPKAYVHAIPPNAVKLTGKFSYNSTTRTLTGVGSLLQTELGIGGFGGGGTLGANKGIFILPYNGHKYRTWGFAPPTSETEWTAFTSGSTNYDEFTNEDIYLIPNASVTDPRERFIDLMGAVVVEGQPGYLEYLVNSNRETHRANSVNYVNKLSTRIYYVSALVEKYTLLSQYIYYRERTGSDANGFYNKIEVNNGGNPVGAGIKFYDDGNIEYSGLPTAYVRDGVLWSDNGVLKIGQ